MQERTASRARSYPPVAWSAVPAASPTPDRTLVLLKPDAVERGLIGEIIARFEAKGLTIAALDMRTLDTDILAQHYAEHVGKGFYDDLVTFMSRGPSSPSSSRVRRTRGRSCGR